MKTFRVSVTQQTVEQEGRKSSFEELGFYENLGQFYVPLSGAEIRQIILDNYPDATVELVDELPGCKVVWDVDFMGKMRAQINKEVADYIFHNWELEIYPRELCLFYELTTNAADAILLENVLTQEVVTLCKRPSIICYS